MSIRLYNSLTKKKEELIPLEGKTIKMYSCGVTVYDECHVGHARSLYVFDVIRRYLKYRGYHVEFVRNITDIDDKIINRANELKKTSQAVAEENIAAYYQDLKNLEIERADAEPKATDNIPDMITHIQGLVEQGYAYAVDGDVYFQIRKFPDYGKLSGQSIDQMMEAVRIEKDSRKKDPLDFALWKKSKAGEPSWESPWGPGRPGWHIECSCMSLKHLHCETLDIHAGGRDLVFPHHENELAQSEALTRKPLAKYWIHHGLLTIRGQKMSKSTGNFITVADALKKYRVEYLKLFFLFSHYASPVDFSDEKMEEARRAYERLTILFNKIKRLDGTSDVSRLTCLESEFALPFQKRFEAAMDDDFNSPKALAVLFDLVNECNKILEGDEDDAAKLNEARCIFLKMGDVFGLKFFRDEPAVGLSDLEVERYIQMRNDFKRQKKYKEADGIREELLMKGIIFEDTKEGTTWRRRI